MTEQEWPEWYLALPRKLMGAGLLIRDSQDRVLLVNPTYKTTWEIPGGVVEADESPRAAAAREVREELGFDVEVGRLLVHQWTARRPGRGDHCNYLYDGGVVAPGTTFTIDPDELLEARFFEVDELDSVLHPYVSSRVRAGLRALVSGALAETEEHESGPESPVSGLDRY